MSGVWELLREIRRGSDSPPALCVPPTLLDLPADALAERFGVGLRQFERRFLESYGQALRSYRRQLRCSRLLASLAGSDANSLNGRGLPAINLGIGAQNPHANDEFILRADFRRACALALELMERS